MRQYRAGISPLVGVVVLFAVVTGTLGLILNVALPMMDRMEDTGTIQAQIDFLQQLDDDIWSVVQEGRYSTRTPTTRVRRGQLVIDPADDRIVYRLRTDSPIISRNTTVQRGAVTLTADNTATFAASRGNKTVRASLAYSDINLTGAGETLSRGNYRLLVRNTGARSGVPQVSVAAQ